MSDENDDKKDPLDSWERIARIISLIGIPFIIAFFGWLLQDKLSEKTVSKDYVNMAISILTDDKKDINPALRKWSVDLLNDNSPTKFDKSTLEQLKSGQINFPSFIKDLYAGNSSYGNLTISANSQYFAIAKDSGEIEIWTYGTSKLMQTIPNRNTTVTCLTFSPDSKELYTGGLNTKVEVWDVQSGRLVREFIASRTPITGIAIAPDNKTFLVSSQDGTIAQWDIASARLLLIIKKQ